VTRSA